MRLLESGDRLVLRDTARAQRVLGAVFVASGAFMFSLPWHMAGWEHLGAWQRVAIFAVGAGHLLGGCYVAWQPPRSHLELDRARGEGVLRWLRPWDGTPVEPQPAPETRFQLGDVRAVEVATVEGGDGDTLWTLRLRLDDGRELPLLANPIGLETPVRELEARVRAFLSGAPPSRSLL